MIETEKIAGFYDTFHHRLVRGIAGNMRLESIKNALARVCQVKPGCKVLDIGCGVGITSLYMAQLGAIVTAFDLSVVNISYAEKYMNHSNVRYSVADATPFESGEKYDVICLCDVFEHIPSSRLSGLLKMIEKHSHDETVIYLNIPDGRFISFLQKHKPELLQIVDESHSISEVIEYFSGIGFTPLEIQGRAIECPAQYVEYIFVKNEQLQAIYQAKT